MLVEVLKIYIIVYAFVAASVCNRMFMFLLCFYYVAATSVETECLCIHKDVNCDIQ